MNQCFVQMMEVNNNYEEKKEKEKVLMRLTTKINILKTDLAKLSLHPNSFFLFFLNKSCASVFFVFIRSAALVYGRTFEWWLSPFFLYHHRRKTNESWLKREKKAAVSWCLNSFMELGEQKVCSVKHTQIPEIQPGDSSRVIRQLHNRTEQFVNLSIFLCKRFHIDD